MLKSMSKQKYNLISSIISLTLTSFLLVFICLAWYVTNKDASVTGGSVITANTNITDVSLSRYLAVFDNNGTEDELTDDFYTIGDNLNEITNAQIPTFDMLGEYSKVIYEISFKTTAVDSVKLSMKTSTKYNHNLVADANGDYYNFLSNVAKFNKLSLSGGKYTISDATSYGFQLVIDRNLSLEIGDYDISTMTSVDGYYRIYLLFDYNVGNINTIFRYNLGTDAGSAETIYFKEDITLFLEG